MRVLFLATRFPVPSWRGDQIRAAHQLRELAGRHALTLAALVERPPSAAERAEVEGWGVRVCTIPLPVWGRIPAMSRVLSGDPRPLQTLWFARPAAQAAVRSLLDRERFDLVHAQLVRTAAYLPAAPTPPVVLDFIDAMATNMERRAARSRGPMRWVAAFEAARLARFEPLLLQRVAAGVAVTAEDADLIAPGRVAVVPNGVDGNLFAFVPGPRPRPRIMFGGNLGYFPNVDAAQWLAREIFPRIRAAVPDAELRLVGARPARAVRALASLAGVSVAADVPSMAAELASARVAVLPMRAGTGLQNKVLEALAVGTPVVATTRATGALAVRSGEHLLVEDSAAALADAATALLQAPERGSALALAGRQLVEARYTWAAAAAQLENVWDAARGASA